MVSGVPHELFTGVGVGAVWAFEIQGTVEPVLGGKVNVGVANVIVACVVVVQPFASVTVTVYVPAFRPLKSCVVAPPGLHKYV
jgi:hypothetical protein